MGVMPTAASPNSAGNLVHPSANPRKIITQGHDMSFDTIIKVAADNGGKASETLSAPYAARTSNAPDSGAAPALPTDSKLIAREGRDYKNRANRFRNFREGDLLRDMEDVNRAIKVAKEYKKNIADKDRARQMRLLRGELERSRIIPLQMSVIPSPSLRFLPPNLVAVADSLSRLTGMDAQGIIYALLGAIPIATWGRVTIRLSDHWVEAAVNMLLQVSPSGTRKSALVRELRMPFDQFCAEVNEGHEDRMRQARTKQRLLAMAAVKRAHKKIVDALNQE